MNPLYRGMVTLLGISLAVPVAIFYFLCNMNVKPTLLPMENEALKFSFHLTPSVEGKNQALDNLKNPISLQTATPKGYPPIPLVEMAPNQESAGETGVSFILVGKTTKLAIIKGAVLREGDTIQGARVTKIEKDRVLLKNGEEARWLMAK